MILVTGATGLVGCHLLWALLKNNEPVRALYRRGSDLERVKRIFSYYSGSSDTFYDKIQWFEADILDLAKLNDSFQDISRVYHCAALISFDPRDKDRLYETNVIGTTNVVNLCVRYGIEKLCYVSSIAALGDALECDSIDENTEWDDQTISNYAITKHQAEIEVWRGVQEGVPSVIVNPGIIVGPGFWHTGSGTLFKMVAKGQKWYPPGGTGFVTIQDVIQSMVRLMDSEIKNKRYVLVNQNLTYKEIFSMIALEFDLPVPKKELQLWQLKLLLPFDWILSKLLNKSRRITRDNIRSVSRIKIYKGEKICRQIDFSYELLNEAVAFGCQKYKEEHPEKFIR